MSQVFIVRDESPASVGTRDQISRPPHAQLVRGRPLPRYALARALEEPASNGFGRHTSLHRRRPKFARIQHVEERSNRLRPGVDIPKGTRAERFQVQRVWVSAIADSREP